MTTDQIFAELSLWLHDDAARGCGKFMLHHSTELSEPVRAALDLQVLADHADTLTITPVVQHGWPYGTWRVIPCCATMELRVNVKDHA